VLPAWSIQFNACKAPFLAIDVPADADTAESCDNFVRNGGALAASNSSCAMACGGNSAEICGGPNLMTVYSKGTLQAYQPPTSQTKNLPGNWSYAGCLS
jgi:hypothetical protein